MVNYVHRSKQRRTFLRHDAGARCIYRFSPNRYLVSVGESAPWPSIVRDERNLYHLLVERADRGVTVEDVEAVLRDPDTIVTRRPDGVDFRSGRTLAGRFLRVVTIGEREIYPKTAYWIDEHRWRRDRGEAV